MIYEIVKQYEIYADNHKEFNTVVLHEMIDQEESWDILHINQRHHIKRWNPHNIKRAQYYQHIYHDGTE